MILVRILISDELSAEVTHKKRRDISDSLAEKAEFEDIRPIWLHPYDSWDSGDEELIVIDVESTEEITAGLNELKNIILLALYDAGISKWSVLVKIQTPTKVLRIEEKIP